MGAPLIWTTEKIKTEARKQHGKKYDYSQIQGNGRKTFVNVGCKLHGLFDIKVSRIVKGDGCPSCLGNYRKSKEQREQIGSAQRGIAKGPSPHRMSVPEIKARIRELHGNKFGLEFITSDIKTRHLTLVCKVHGKFDKGRGDILHSSKTGCPKCNGGKKLTPEEYVARIKPNQPKWMSFKDTDYQGSQFLVTAVCKYHGEVRFKPYSILFNAERIACLDCNAQRIRDKRIASGQYPDPKTQDLYLRYRQTVRRLSNRAARKHFPGERTHDLHLDHIFSIKEGFRLKVPARVIGHITNLELSPRKVNQSKQTKCGKTLVRLYKDYEKWIRKNAS